MSHKGGDGINKRKEANQEQRSKLARTLFQEVWIKDKQVVAVKPQPEFEPFFQLNYQEFVNKSLKMRPRGDSNSYLQYLEFGLFPVYAPVTSVVKSKRKLPISLRSHLCERHKTKSLRQLAKEYQVSHETMRRTLGAARQAFQ